jgi:hypothetical protein
MKKLLLVPLLLASCAFAEKVTECHKVVDADGVEHCSDLKAPKDWDKDRNLFSVLPPRGSIPENYLPIDGDLWAEGDINTHNQLIGNCYAHSAANTFLLSLVTAYARNNGGYKKDPSKIKDFIKANYQSVHVGMSQCTDYFQGGWQDSYYNNLLNKGGALWANVPEVAKRLACNFLDPKIRIKKWGYIDGNKNWVSEQQIKIAILKYGAVSIASASKCLSTSKSVAVCNNKNIDHATTLYGWEGHKFYDMNSWYNGYKPYFYDASKVGAYAVSYVEVPNFADEVVPTPDPTPAPINKTIFLYAIIGVLLVLLIVIGIWRR